MSNLKKDNYSQYLDNATLPMVNDTCNGVPNITSTPLTPRHGHLLRRSSVLGSPTKSKLIAPRRYSLSEMNPPTNKSNLGMYEAHSPGPLLASLSFKDNVSLYEETKSSGLARRIVLYNEEAEHERQPTHQEKYHSPGLFPIVHLFKKKPPFLEQSPKRVKIKLSSPDYLKSYSPQHRSSLLEGLSKPRLQNQHSLSSCSQKSNSTGTKSVLDALKEISRKRIHSNEECDINEDSGKRVRTELQNGTTTTSKRNRADSPLLDSSESPSPKQTQKKFCVYDEFAASKSSTDFSFLNKMEPARTKRKTTSTSTESLKETKHVKFLNAETQTIPSNRENKTKSVEINTDEFDSQKSTNKESPLKVFDDAPLHRIRKNRLAALMGNLSGKGAAILPKVSIEENFSSESKESEEKEEPVEESNESEIIAVPPSIIVKESGSETSLANKPLISILSPTKTTKELSPVKSDKHVHFILPGTTSSSTFNQNLLAQTLASVVTPIASAAISHSSVSNNTENNTGPVSSAEISSKTLTTPSSTLHLFENQSPSKSITQVSSNTSSPSFNFSASLPTPKQDLFTIPKLTFESPKTSSPQKLGGFKFELKTSSTTSLVTTTGSNSATSTLTFSNPPTISNTASTTAALGASSTAFTIGKPTEPNKKDSTFSFGAPTTISSSTIPEPTFGFGGVIPNSQTFDNISAESKLPSLKTTSAGFNFSSTEKNSMFGTTTPSTFTTTLVPSNGSQNINHQSSHPTFSFTPNTAVTTTSRFTFGTTTAVTASGFESKPTSNFGSNNTSTVSSAMFGNSDAAVVPSFGKIPATSGSAFGGIVVTSAPGFGSVPITLVSTSVAAAPIFSSTNTKSVFGTTPVTSTAIFGLTSASNPSFANTAVTSTSVFGSTNLPTSGFGAAGPTTTSSVFGTNTSTFGSNLTTTTAIFGSSNAKPPAFGSSSAFGATNPQDSTFGSNTTPGFGNSSQQKPVFGSSSTTSNAPPAFGSNTFGGSTTGAATTTSAPMFGASNPNSTFTFGSSKPTANVFGSVTTTSSNTFGSNTFSSTSGFESGSRFGNNTPAFGSSTATSNAFGGTSTPAFGQVENKPAFGQVENKPAFGQVENKPAFGQVESKPTFGQVESKSAFAFGGSGENKANSVFGSGAGNSAFGKPTNTQSGFGNSTGGFGTTSTGGFSSQTNGVFNFGSNAATSSPAPFAFGAPSGNPEPPKPSFNFTGGVANPPSFGSNSSTPSFGSSNPTFGAPTFAAPGAPSAGVFNIGAGSNSGRPRTQLRAKRRT